MMLILDRRIGGMTKDGILWDGCIIDKKNNTSNVEQIISDLSEAGIFVQKCPFKFYPSKNSNIDTFTSSGNRTKTPIGNLAAELG